LGKGVPVGDCAVTVVSLVHQEDLVLVAELPELFNQGVELLLGESCGVAEYQDMCGVSCARVAVADVHQVRCDLGHNASERE